MPKTIIKTILAKNNFSPLKSIIINTHPKNDLVIFNTIYRNNNGDFHQIIVKITPQ